MEMEIKQEFFISTSPPPVLPLPPPPQQFTFHQSPSPSPFLTVNPPFLLSILKSPSSANPQNHIAPAQRIVGTSTHSTQTRMSDMNIGQNVPSGSNKSVPPSFVRPQCCRNQCCVTCCPVMRHQLQHLLQPEQQLQHQHQPSEYFERSSFARKPPKIVGGQSLRQRVENAKEYLENIKKGYIRTADRDQIIKLIDDLYYRN
ncbi:uncharacterized protein LOC112538512 [Tetranychus urticae]|uniref:uncharacterized protein LOC112538512 n=1 Tax=Tetranychus urticae TaxID=32264 RepID=UPI000D641564|nr:uncharacterized protein LOC112538512 [Tetranychus urticae]